MVMLLPRDLINPDINQPGQPTRIQHIHRHALTDRTDRTPPDPSELTGRHLIGFRDQPRHQLLDITAGNSF
jgi:hypothetical protein